MEIKLATEPKLAIVGMDAYFGHCESLEAWERSIYEGKPQQNSSVVELEDLPTEQLLRKVANNALQDANLVTGVKVAVIVANDESNPIVPKMGNFLNLSPENSVFQAIATAQKLLFSGTVDTVLIVASASQDNIGAVVLQFDTTAKQQHNRIYAEIVTNVVQDSPQDSEAIQKTCEAAFAQSGIEPAAIGYIDICSQETVSADDARITSAIAAYGTSETSCSCALGNTTNLGVVAEIASIIKTALCLYYRYIPAFPQWSLPKNAKRHNNPFYVAPQSKPWFLAAEATRIAAIHSNYAHVILSEAPERQECQGSYLEETSFYLFLLASSDRNTLQQQLRTLEQAIEASDSLSFTAQQTFITYQRYRHCPYALAILGKTKKDLLREIERAFKGIDQAFATQKDWQTPTGSYFTVNPQGRKGKVAYVYPGAYNAHLGLGRNLFRIFPKLFDDPVIQSTRNRLAKLERLLYPRSWEQLSRRKLEALEAKLMSDPLAMLESEMGFAGLMTAVLRDYFQIQPEGIFGYSLGEISGMYAQGVWTDMGQSSDRLNTSSLFKTRLAGSKEAVREYWQLPESERDIWCTYVLMASASMVKERVQQESRVFLTQISTPKEVVIAGDPSACQRVIQDLNCDAFRAPFNHVIHCPVMDSEYEELVRINTLPLQNHLTTTFYSAAHYEPIDFNSQAISEIISQTLCQQLDFSRLVNRLYQDEFRIFIEVGAGSNCSRWIREILKSQEHLTVSLHRRGIEDHVSLVKALAKLVSHRVELDLSPLYNQGQKSLSFETQSNIRNYADFSPKKSLKDSKQKSIINNNYQGVKVTKATKNVASNEDIATIKSEQKKVVIQNNFTDHSTSLKSNSDISQESTNAVGNTEKELEFFEQKVRVNIPDSELKVPYSTGKYGVLSQSISNGRDSSEPRFRRNHAVPRQRRDRIFKQKLAEGNSKITQIHANFLQSRQENLSQISKIVLLELELVEQQYTKNKQKKIIKR